MSVADELQKYCDLFGHPHATIWDRYDSSQRSALVHKLNCIFGSSEDTKSVREEAPHDVDDASGGDQVRMYRQRQIAEIKYILTYTIYIYTFTGR